MRSAQELKQIAGFSGAFIISADQYSATDLNQIASFASASGARVTLKNCGHLALHELNGIASFGKGAVVFDFTA